ncbi:MULTISPECIES: hypothetical protein [Peribacillus]|uniref:hypothetical protein n=1 Tax=Peribacillus TaxID=2675229 RepID=UPI001F4DAD96|nr:MULTISPECIES: hypothetical protein [unclassified Peribacillus]MCK1981515.1 hypothetical protein [Peribacillus sp. Aquil_B1]MCK2006738.1 hypothetical protein [Peribacillus sp. Aquil_B8]
MEFRNAAFNPGKINDVDGSKMAVFYGDAIYTSFVNKLRAAGCVFAEEEDRLLISAARTVVLGLDLFTKKRARHHKKGPVKWSLFDIISLASLRFL